MNSNTKTARTSLFARRVLPVLGIVTLTVALGACQTPLQGAAAPQKQVVQDQRVAAQEAQDAATLQSRSHVLVQQSIRDARVKAAQDAATLQSRSYVLVQQSIEDALQKAHAAAVAERQAAADAERQAAAVERAAQHQR